MAELSSVTIAEIEKIQLETKIQQTLIPDVP